jgi:hypothetical protein
MLKNLPMKMINGTRKTMTRLPKNSHICFHLKKTPKTLGGSLFTYVACKFSVFHLLTSNSLIWGYMLEQPRYNLNIVESGVKHHKPYTLEFELETYYIGMSLQGKKMIRIIDMIYELQ